MFAKYQAFEMKTVKRHIYDQEGTDVKRMKRLSFKDVGLNEYLHLLFKILC